MVIDVLLSLYKCPFIVVDGEHDPLGLEDVGEKHGLPRHALIGAGPGLAGGRLWRCFLLAGGGSGPDVVLVLLRLGFGLLGHRHRLAAGSATDNGRNI